MNFIKTSYGDSDDSDKQDESINTNFTSNKDEGSTFSIAPFVHPTNIRQECKYVDDKDKILLYNPTVEELYSEKVGPENPFKSSAEKQTRNIYTGYVEETHLNEVMFEKQRIDFTAAGKAVDPSQNSKQMVVKTHTPNLNTDEDFRLKKREDRGDPGDIENFKGPWANYIGINSTAKPSEEQFEKLEEMRIEKIKRKAQSRPPKSFDFHKRRDLDDDSGANDPPTIEEKYTLHLKTPYDYQGRSFLHPPVDVDVNLKREDGPSECFIPKKLNYTWKAHAKGVSVLRVFPNSGHLMLTGGMDAKIKLWQTYKERELVYTFEGHREAIRDLCFTNDGTQFLSASYDRWIKLWDTETGKCIQRFTHNKIPYCVKFHPDEDKQHLFIAGMVNFKMITWDTRENQIVQEYDRHLGPVNTISFFDNNQRIVTTSDDKSVRVWEWDIPVDTKYIADPSMHSIPAVCKSNNGRWLAGQSMDNRIVIFDLFNNVREKRKSFRGHVTSGYACQPCFSPDGKFLMSGDGQGKLNIWAWKKSKLICRFDAHKKVVIGCAWLPHESSKILTCSWDGLIKLWS